MLTDDIVACFQCWFYSLKHIWCMLCFQCNLWGRIQEVFKGGANEKGLGAPES